MSISKKNTGLVLMVALVLLVIVFAIMITATSYAGVLPWSSNSHFVAYCVTSSCTVG